MPELVVMKFGGTSVRDEASRAAALDRVRAHVAEERRVVVVVSAMGRAGEPYATDTLIQLLRGAGEPVSARELDLIMSCGEIISAAYFTQLLVGKGIPALAFTGRQAGILTDEQAGQAEILDVRPKLVRRALMQGKVAVVAGFQGMDADGEVRTLGRGGSDTSAVALGTALDAQVVELYTDVDGIAAADPRRVPQAPFLDEIAAPEILAMAEEGSRVLHPRAVRAALATRTLIRSRNTFNTKPGTLIHHRASVGEPRPVALAHRENLMLLQLPGKKDPRKTVPELIEAGGFRYLLLNDVYLGERLSRLRQEHGNFKFEDGWATASVVLSADEIPPAPPAPKGSEALPARPRVWHYLLREERLDEVLGELYERHFGTE